MKSIYKVVFISDPFTITKKDNTTCQKQFITLRFATRNYEGQEIR